MGNISFEKNKKELAAHDTPNFNIFSSKDIHDILCVYNKTIRWRLSLLTKIINLLERQESTRFRFYENRISSFDRSITMNVVYEFSCFLFLPWFSE